MQYIVFIQWKGLSIVILYVFARAKKMRMKCFAEIYRAQYENAFFLYSVVHPCGGRKKPLAIKATDSTSSMSLRSHVRYARETTAVTCKRTLE